MHIPVLKEEAIRLLDAKPNENFIDATCGSGGHTLAILEKNGPNGQVLAIDRSPEQAESCRLKTQKYGARVKAIIGNFADLKDIISKANFQNIKGILFDLGLSSWHLDESGRGFSFRKSEPLDMRFNAENRLTAQEILNFWSKSDLVKIFQEYGEEKFANRIAEEIIHSRQAKLITDTLQLIEIIKKAVPVFYRHRKIHCATKVFQALRIAVNQELDAVERAVQQAMEALEPDARIVIISFHSLEDRIVKNFFRENAKKGKLEILTKKPIAPSFNEIKLNPRARSAKLRAAKKLITK